MTPSDDAPWPRLMLVWSARSAQIGISTPDALADALLPIERAVACGLRLLQLRDPQGDEETQRALLLALRERYPELKLLVNSRAELARETGAGLHLPERLSLPPWWPPERPWGRSVHSVEAAHRAEEEGARYVVLGTVFPTASKPGHPGAGLELVRETCRAVKVPVFAIGGIDASRVAAVLGAGAHGVAVQSAILAAADPGATTEALLREIDAFCR